MKINTTQFRHPDLLEKLAWYWLVCADKTLKSSAKVLASRLALYHHNSKDGRCDPSAATLAEGVARSTRSIDPALKALRDAGWISWTSVSGYAHRYRLERVPFKGTGMNSDPAPLQPTADVEDDAPLQSTAEGGLQSTAEEGTKPTSEKPVREPVREPVISPQPPTAAAAGGAGSRTPTGRKGSPRANSRQHDGGTAWPANLELDEHLTKVAERERVPIADIGRAFAGFKAHALDKGRTSNNWDAAWQGWCQTHTERRQAREPRPAVNKRFAI